MIVSTADIRGALPQRLFLDSCTLQAFSVGSVVDMGTARDEIGGGGRSGATVRDVQALADIFDRMNHHPIEFMVSARSFHEVRGAARADPRATARLELLRLVAEHAEAVLLGGLDGHGEHLAARLREEPRFDYLSAKDRKLLGEALLTECDAFVTVERKLARNGGHVFRELGLLIVRPPELEEAYRLTYGPPPEHERVSSSSVGQRGADAAHR